MHRLELVHNLRLKSDEKLRQQVTVYGTKIGDVPLSDCAVHTLLHNETQQQPIGNQRRTVIGHQCASGIRGAADSRLADAFHDVGDLVHKYRGNDRDTGGLHRGSR
jgi:hypothetical protein